MRTAFPGELVREETGSSWILSPNQFPVPIHDMNNFSSIPGREPEEDLLVVDDGDEPAEELLEEPVGEAPEESSDDIQV